MNAKEFFMELWKVSKLTFFLLLTNIIGVILICLDRFFNIHIF